MSSLQQWLLASRPATLLCALAPLLVGGAIAHAHQGFAFLPWFAALLAALCIQIGTNFANDVFDYIKGADDEDRLGPTRAVQAGLISVASMKRALMIAFLLAILFGSYLVWHAGWPILAIGIASLISGIAYTGGPYPLGYNGLGDLFVFIFFGIVAVCGTVYVQLLELPAVAYIASIPMGSISTAIIGVNNIRDAQTDVRVGKKTLAVRFGQRFARTLYVLLIASAYLTPVILYVVYSASTWIFLPWLSLPLAFALCRTLWTSSDAQVLNKVLKQTAMLLLVFGLPFALGILGGIR